MDRGILLIAITISSIGFSPVFAESYNLKIDEHSYDLEYEVNANVLAMEIDQELNSLLIGIENTNDSTFSIKLPNEMISAENNEFAVLVDGQEVGYEINSMGDKTEMTFFVLSLSQEIEIIGTHVIPEFPFVILILILMISGVIVLSKKNNLRIK